MTVENEHVVREHMDEDQAAPKKFDKFESYTQEAVFDSEGNLYAEKLPLVIRRDKLAPLISGIAQTYADCVCQTFGPGGYDSIIEMTNGVITTKDGWMVAKSLTLRLNADLTALGRMVLDVAANVNLKVGDATTTAILVANELNKRMQKLIAHWESINVPMYVIKEALEYCVTMVCDQVWKNRTSLGPLPEEQRLNAIENVAKVSSNWNIVIAAIIRDIYKKTDNPYIRVERAGGTELSYDIVHGYDMKGMLHLPEHYVNSPAKEAAVLKNPIILMFDFDVRATQMMLPLTLIGSALATKNIPLVIMAPGFENDFVKGLGRVCNQNSSVGKPIPNMICVKMFLEHQGDRDMYRDFSMILGANLIGNDTQDEFLEMCNDLRKQYALVQEAAKKMNLGPATGEEAKKASAEFNEVQNNLNELVVSATNYATTYCGSCEELEVGAKRVVATIDESMWTKEQVARIKDLRNFVKAKLDSAVKKSDSLSAILIDVGDLRTRYSKLSCNSGVIKVGGYGDGDIKAKMDALDDAISACRSVYENGYTLGGNYAVPQACFEIKKTDLTPMQFQIIGAICESFLQCIMLVHTNYFGKLREDFNEIVQESIERKAPYNVIEDEYDPELIESPVVSMEVLRGSMRLVKLIATSNQYLYKKYTVSELIGADDVI